MEMLFEGSVGVLSQDMNDQIKQPGQNDNYDYSYSLNYTIET